MKCLNFSQCTLRRIKCLKFCCICVWILDTLYVWKIKTPFSVWIMYTLFQTLFWLKSRHFSLQCSLKLLFLIVTLIITALISIFFNLNLCITRQNIHIMPQKTTLPSHFKIPTPNCKWQDFWIEKRTQFLIRYSPPPSYQNILYSKQEHLLPTPSLGQKRSSHVVWS